MRRRRDDEFPDNGFEAWGGYMNAKVAKLEEQFNARAEKREDQISDIFSGISIYVNGYTIPSADELKKLMLTHGGIYHTYQRSGDYIIASNLPDTKVKNMSLVKVVRPEWITESITANRLLDFRDYLLYSNSKTQPRINFNKTTKSEGNSSKQGSLKQVIDNDDIKNHVATANNSKNYFENKDVPDCLKYDSKSMLANSNFCNIIKINDVLKKGNQTTKTAVDPNFISEFYSNSRLHHISQLGACFKQYINDLREKGNFLFPARSKLKKTISLFSASNKFSPIMFEKGRTIMHIDMDCFFVSVGLRQRPHLRGKPVAVTHSKGGQAREKREGVDRNVEFNLYRQKQTKKIGKATGLDVDDIEIESRIDNITDEDDKYGSMSEIASCSYEARAKGISNGMFMGAALKLCPDLQTIPYDFEGYKEVAYNLYDTVAQYTLDIEAVSCDEMYVDCTELLSNIDVSVQDFASALRSEIKVKTDCPCSTGFGGNRLQARLATKRAKPDGQFFLSSELVSDFMHDIKLQDLPGVGKQTALKLQSLGHEICGSLQSLSLTFLQEHLGNKTGAQLYDQCRGRDNNPLNFHTVRKSVSAEVNYGIRFENNEHCIEFLTQLSHEVHTRMQQFKVIGKCITLKLMIRAEDAPIETAKFLGHGFCNVINKSSLLNVGTNDVEIITKEVISLCKKLKIDPKEMRGVGIQITKLESTVNHVKTGAMSKYLSSKSVKSENKMVNKKVTKPENSLKYVVPTTPKKKVLSPVKKSPILQTKSPQKSPKFKILKSPISKRRGRPSKNLSIRPRSNLIAKFLQAPSHTSETTFKTQTIAEPTKPQKPEKEIPQGLLALDWKQIREMLRAWLESEQTPLACDVDLITSYLREMVINKKLEKLNILLKFLKRRTFDTKNKDWMEVFNNIVENVQNAMIAVYGKKLFICD